METMTPGVELIHAIVQTARDIADAIHGETIQKLRDELAKAKAELANVKEDTADLIIERDELKQRAERAESGNANYREMENLKTRIGNLENAKNRIMAALGMTQWSISNVVEAIIAHKERSQRVMTAESELTNCKKSCRHCSNELLGVTKALDITRHKLTVITKERDEAVEVVLKDAKDFQHLANAVGLPFNTIMQEIKQPGKKLMFVNDEALAKLEQPRMFMRDGGQLWEVFQVKSTLEYPGEFQFFEEGKWHDKIGDYQYSGSLYRRPITPSELQGWIEPQPTGEVLFEDELYVSEKQIALLASGKYAAPCKGRDDITPIPVHVTIRKAGE